MCWLSDRKEEEKAARENEKEEDDDIEESKAEGPAKTKRSSSSQLKSIFEIFGPGVITGASDDDPSGIATYSQVGAQFGFGILWMVLFLYPLMTVVQEMCARIGLVSGSGLAGVIKKRHSMKIVYPIVSLLIIA